MSWQALVDCAGGRPNPSLVFGDPALARQVLAEHLAGAVDGAVTSYLDGDDHAELARSLLTLLRPPAAADRCFATFRDADVPLGRRQAAVDLLRVVADARALDWIGELLADPDGEIQRCGALVLEGLIRREQVELADADPLLEAAERHPNRAVHEAMHWLREELDRRRRHAAPDPLGARAERFG